MKSLLVSLLLVLLAAPTLAGTYTITTTAQQDAALQFVVNKENEFRASQVPSLSPLTIQQYLQVHVNGVTRNFVASMLDERVGSQIGAQWSTLTTTQKQDVCTQLSVSAANCPP